MERFKNIDVTVIDQKENNPSLAKDEKDRNAQDGNATVNYVPQAGTYNDINFDETYLSYAQM